MSSIPAPPGDSRRDERITRIESAVQAHLTRLMGPKAGATLVVAVSGGPDSVALLRALAAVAPGAGLTLVVAHLDHGLRGDAGADDAAFVSELAARLGLACRRAGVDAAELARRERRSLEDAARRARRRFLEEVRAAVGAVAVALGHTRDDQAETVLLNLLRGAGARGLGGMPPHGPGSITRPLLAVSRAEVLSYLDALGQNWRVDASNEDTRFTRNRVRHRLLPLIAAEFNPAIADTLVRAAAQFRAIDAHMEASAAAWLDRASRSRHDAAGPTFSRTELSGLPEALRRTVLRAAIRLEDNDGAALRDWGVVHADALEALLAGDEDGALDLPGGWRAHRVGDTLRLVSPDARVLSTTPQNAEWPPAQISTATPGDVSTPRGTLRLFRVARRPGAPLPRPDGRSAAFDLRGFPASLTVRPAHPGDRMTPFGGPGSRPVVDLLAERGVPAAARPGWPVVTVGEAAVTAGVPGSNSGLNPILWVPGIRRSADGAVVADSREVIILEWFGELNVNL